VTVDKPKAEIMPTMWGIFFEDINFGADGVIMPNWSGTGHLNLPSREPDGQSV